MLNGNETTATEESDRKPAARLLCDKCGCMMETDANDTGNNIGGIPGGTCTCEKYEGSSDYAMAQVVKEQRGTGTERAVSKKDSANQMNDYWEKSFRRESLMRKNCDLPSEGFVLAQNSCSSDEDVDDVDESNNVKSLQETLEVLCSPVPKKPLAKSGRKKTRTIASDSKSGSKELAEGDDGSSVHTGSIPGAYAQPGIGARSAENVTLDGRDSAVDEVLASLEETENYDSSDTNLAPQEEAPRSNQDSLASIAKANMVDDAEPIFVAQDVQHDNFKRNIAKGTLSVLALIAIVVMVIIILTQDDPEEPQCLNEDLFCCLPIEEQHIFERCFCANSTAGMYGNLTEVGREIYDQQFNFLRMSPLLERYGSDDWDVDSCNPFNQALLHVGQNEAWGASAGALGTIPLQVYATFLYMMEAYVLMDGLHWTNSAGFMENTDLCSWFGVRCLFIDVVHELRLPTNGLSGELTISVVEASQLRALDLSSNTIWGTLPPEISNMSNLIELRLSELQLTGTLPATWGTMEQLRLLSLQENQLRGTIPPSYFGLPYIRTLELNLNKLTGTLPTIGYSSSQMGVLRLNGNNFTGSIPSELSNLSNLELLNIGRNNFTGTIPEFLGTMPRLQFINLFESGLTGRIPDSLCRNNRKPADFLTIVVECATTELCSCCSSDAVTFAPIRVRCAEDIPEQAIGF
jgi:Leucine-rich repeat (LRR) protein